MKLANLYDLIKYLERGTKLHIGVFFVGNKYNDKCALPRTQTIHSKAVCEKIKNVPEQYQKCFRCRNFALKKAIIHKKPFASLCVNGVFEYTCPVVFEDKVIAVIFIGNILTPEGYAKLIKNYPKNTLPLDTMEENYTFDDCDALGKIIAGYIVVLIKNYSSENGSENALIKNIKVHILQNLEYDVKVSDVASLFHYNEAYLGRLFKSRVGQSLKEYINHERIKLAKELLKQKYSISEIAIKTGFNTVSYFNRVFKCYTGLSPSEYKAEHITTQK